MNKIILAYCRDNAELAAAIEQPLSRLGIPFENVSNTNAPAQPRDQFAAYLRDTEDPVLLLLTDNLLKNRDCLSGMLNLVQTLTRQQRLLVVIADGKTENGEKAETHIDRMVNAIQYSNYWQSIYLDQSARQSGVAAAERPAFDEQLAVVRDISNEIFELISAFRESDHIGWDELLADDFALFFEKFRLAEWHEQYRRLVTPAPPPAPEKPAQPPAMTGLLAPSPAGAGSLNWPDDQPAAPPPGEPAPETSFEHINSLLDEIGAEEPSQPQGGPETAVPDIPGATTVPADKEDNISQTIRDAWFWLENGHVARGLEVFELTLEEHPAHAVLRAQYEEALAKYARQPASPPPAAPETVPELPPSTSEAKSYEVIGEEALAKGDYLFAKFCWDRVAELSPYYPGIYRKLGLLTSEYLQDYRETAVHYLEKALEEQPDDAEVRDRLTALLQPPPPAEEQAPLQVEASPEPTSETRAGADRVAEAPAPEPELAPSEPELAHSAEETTEALALPSVPQDRLTVLITGATSGIGLATATLFARHGHRLILTGRRDDRLNDLKKQLTTDYRADVHTLHFDVRDYAAVREQLENLPEGWRNVDVLLNNAGLAKGFAPIHEGNLEHWETMIDTNLKGLLYVTRCIAPHMVRRHRGHIINLGSSAGKEVYVNGNVYCATKFAVDALTRAMRLDLHTHNIRVSQVSPGHVEETEFALTRFDGDAAKAQIYQDFQPLKAGDVAEVIYFIATRPPHVNIQDVWLFGAQQASAAVIDRSGRG